MRLSDAFGLTFTQSEVDFVIPDLTVDLPLAIDPFLLFKSRDEALRELHSHLVSIFNEGIRLFRDGERAELNSLIDFPEVNEIGFGYSERAIRGSGLGWHLNRLLAETLTSSEDLQQRGLRHVEELQLVSIGVGPDRVSDIAANVLKAFLVGYTQEQAQLWDIPLTNSLPVSHYFDFSTRSWTDGYFDLPQNPVSGLPILLVPRRVVRLLPWINYDDYVRSDFRMFLRPSKGPRLPSYPGMPRDKQDELTKQQVIDITRSKLDLVDQYINRKEREGNQAEPTLGDDQFSGNDERARGDEFISRIQAMQSGSATASDYQRLVYDILNFLFEPNLTDGKMEVETHLRTERRDIIYVNEAERSFFEYVRSTYGSMFVLFEIKNVQKMGLDHINQTAAYLGARLGMLGFIVTRHAPGENIILKTYSIYNDSPATPRKTILIVTDTDLITMIQMKRNGQPPAGHLQQLYRDFRWKVQ